MYTSSTPDGERHLRPHGGVHAKRTPGASTSTLRLLSDLVASEHVWRVVEHVETAVPTLGRRRYTLMDIVVMEAATQIFDNRRRAERHLSDPACWKRLRRAATRAFPRDPTRRLASRPPSRSTHYRARHTYGCGEALTELKRAVRTEAVEVSTLMGMFTPGAGSWTAPDRTQSIIADCTWIAASTKYQPPGRRSDVQRGRELVMFSARGPGNERLLLDAEFVFRRNDSTRAAGIAADHAVAMLDRLLAENRTLRRGVRGFVHDTALSAEGIDKVLDLGVLPIIRVPKVAGGTCRRVNLGTQTFTARDGTQHDHQVIAIGGAPTVALPDSRGVSTVVELDRQQIRWEHNNHHNTAYGRYAIPNTPSVPAHLRGAVTVIRINSTNKESNSGKRRSWALRAIPENDAAFVALFGVRADVEAAFADLKRPACHTNYDDFSVVVYLIRRLVAACAASAAAGRGRGTTPRAA